MANEATIVRAPGYVDHFRAKVIPGLHNLPERDGRGRLSVVAFGEGEIAVIPAQCVVLGSVDLVKRFEVEFDWESRMWGVRHAYNGPFVHLTPSLNDARAWMLRKIA